MLSVIKLYTSTLTLGGRAKSNNVFAIDLEFAEVQRVINVRCLNDDVSAGGRGKRAPGTESPAVGTLPRAGSRRVLTQHGR